MPCNKKKKKNKLVQSTIGLVAGSATMGVGSQALGQIGGTPAVHGQQALGTLSGYQPLMAKATGAGMAMEAIGGISMKRKRKRKKGKKRR